MQISKRLQTAVNFVTIGNRVADIGCDHAYTSIYLLQKGIASSVIALDINKGPLQRAKENIKRYGFSDQIETRLSDGAKELHVGEVDTVFITGMGGALVVKILTDSSDVIDSCKELILQPQSEIFLVRHYLHEKGYRITNENMIIEEGKFYVMLRAERSTDGQDLSYDGEFYYQYGRKLLEDRNEILKQYLIKEKDIYLSILDQLVGNPTEQSMKRANEVKQQLKYIEEGLQYYEM
ncbi:MAG TPA: class I SAM-dependent methyltransferase [Lachnospiraceae bacterium]|nr:class I SAM-dependent methyltransferase [Lachnospiraceae bacterium]